MTHATALTLSVRLAAPFSVQRSRSAAAHALALIRTQHLPAPQHPLQLEAVRLIKRRMVIQASAQADGAAGTIEMDIKISGMMCGGCTERVTKVLQEAEGVASVDAVDLETGIATVQVTSPDQFDAATNALPHLVGLIQELGFEAEPHFD